MTRELQPVCMAYCVCPQRSHKLFFLESQQSLAGISLDAVWLVLLLIKYNPLHWFMFCETSRIINWNKILNKP